MGDADWAAAAIAAYPAAAGLFCAARRRRGRQPGASRGFGASCLLASLAAWLLLWAFWLDRDAFLFCGALAAAWLAVAALRARRAA